MKKIVKKNQKSKWTNTLKWRSSIKYQTTIDVTMIITQSIRSPPWCSRWHPQCLGAHAKRFFFRLLHARNFMLLTYTRSHLDQFFSAEHAVVCMDNKMTATIDRFGAWSEDRSHLQECRIRRYFWKGSYLDPICFRSHEHLWETSLDTAKWQQF